MAACPPAQVSAHALSQKQRKAVLRKERRKRKRQAIAQARRPDPETEEQGEVKDEESEYDHTASEKRLRLHEEWLERERQAQEEFRLKREKEEFALKQKEEEERMIKEEWESQQRREKEEKEQKLLERRNREEAVQKMLDDAENQLQSEGPWMNPEAPATVNSGNYGTERDLANCPFFLKTGACRFGERCSRKHVFPTSSQTLMVRGMFRTFGMEELRRDDYDMDACLEHSEEDLHESFLEFYHDVLPEFKSVGKVLQFKVCCNYEPHLRGNVYIQFETEDQCKEAFMKFNGRWYAGRQLQCELSPVTRWKNAICGLFDRHKCPKGKHCNFLHVFRNPGSEFWEADRDLHLSPDRRNEGSVRDGWYSERFRERSSRRSRYSRSPVRSERSHNRRQEDRQRSRSTERRRSFSKEQSSYSRHSSRRGDRYRSERRRSRSRDTVDTFRNKSSERSSRDEDRGLGHKSRSKSKDREKRKPSKEKSSKKSDRSKKQAEDGNTRHHKHSKKSKKSKKKRKKKNQSPDHTASSTESEKEDKTVEETVQNPLVQSSPKVGNTQENVGENDDSEVRSEQTDANVDSEHTTNGNLLV